MTNKGVRRGFASSRTLDAVEALASLTSGGYAVVIPPYGFDAGASTANTSASRAELMQVFLPAPMLLRSLVVRVNAGASGVNRWGLFSAGNDPTSAQLVAGGTGALSSAGWQPIPVSNGGTIFVPPGYYSLIFHNASANPPQILYQSAVSSSGHSMNRTIAPYTWTDSPDLTSGWGATIVNMACFLVGDYDTAGHQH